jgi:chromatin modification-related protein VID21
MMTPQEFSKKRYEHDLKQMELARQQRARIMEQQRKQIEAHRLAAQQHAMQQNGPGGTGPNQQRPTNGQPNGQAQANGQQAPQLPNGQYPQQGTNMNGQQQMAQQQIQQQQGQRQQSVPMATRNGHLAVPQVNGQGMAAQAQMRTPNMNGQMPDPVQMQRYAQAQGRQQQYVGQQGYGAMQSPNGGVGMTAQQTMKSSQAMLATIQAQMNQAPQQPGSNMNQASGMSPSMMPPPAPLQQNVNAGTLSSGHMPVLHSIRQRLKAQFPQQSDDQILQMATELLAKQSQSASTQARQNAMNAAAGLNNVGGANNMQAYGYNQAVGYPNAGGQIVGAGYGADGMAGQGGGTSPQQYSNFLRQNQMAQMRHQQLQGSPAGSHASLNMNGSPSMANASPNTAGMTPVSPNLQYNQMAGMNMAGMQQRPPSRSATGTPQQRPGSAVGVPNMGQGMGSPGSANGMMQGSPGRVQASMAR